jgi:serine/threonine-protein kinase
MIEKAPDGSRRLTSAGMIFGTPEYMAPEQAAGGKIDHRADIYATGIILYKMLTGRAPFSGAQFLEVLEKQVLEEPPRMSKLKPDLDIPKQLEQVVMRSLAKKPDDRFATMARFARAIAYAGRDVRRGKGSRPRVIGPVFFVAVAALAAGAVSWRMRAQPTTLAEEPRPTPAASLAIAATPAAALPPETPSLAAPTPSPEPAPSSAAPVDSAAKGARDAGRVSVVKPQKIEPPPRAPVESPPPATKSLPGIERCFETVAGERREVPCN